MKKFFPQISAFFVLAVITLVASGFLFPQTTHAWSLNPVSWFFGGVADTVLKVVGWLAVLILQLASLLTYLAGALLNYVAWFTIVNMSEQISQVTTINIAWGAIRDLANMSFIFVLLYAAIQTILGIGSDVKKLIVNIIVAAILINFSLFFTKLVIDAANLLAILFYDAIVPGALTSDVSKGISDAMMQNLDLASLWNAEVIALQGKHLIIIGVMGSVFALIAAFVFFAVAIMLVIRYVVLIFVLILSPLAFLGFVLPQLKQQKDQWREALLGQAFFAPIYFMLTWIVIIVSRGLLAPTTGGTLSDALIGTVGTDGNSLVKPSPAAIGVVMNFIVMIVFLIASLIIAKEWANKAGGQVTGLTKWAMGAAGGATLGMAGRLGRGTIGRAGAAVGESEWLKKKAESGSMAARLSLAAGRKTGAASFDIRGTPLSGQLDAGKAQKGGFMGFRKQKSEAEEKFAASLASSAKVQTKAQRKYDEAASEFGAGSRQAIQAKIKLDAGSEKERKSKFAQAIENSYWAKARGYNYDAAAQIRKGKSTKDKAADILKDLQKEGVITEKETPETPPPTPPTPPAGGQNPNP